MITLSIPPALLVIKVEEEEGVEGEDEDDEGDEAETRKSHGLEGDSDNKKKHRCDRCEYSSNSKSKLMEHSRQCVAVASLGRTASPCTGAFTPMRSLSSARIATTKPLIRSL